MSFLINGIGAMGRGLAHQIVKVNRARLLGVSDVDAAKAAACCAWLGLPHAHVATTAAAEAAMAAGKVAVAADGAILAACRAGEIYFEASSAIAEVVPGIMTALAHRKHVSMMNSEADLAFGALFASRADDNGVIYTSADGDQYGVIKRLADEVMSYGFDLVMLGNIKGFLDRRANPASIVAEADKRGLDYRMCAAFTDGTKLSIEMALIANVFGASAAAPGMLGPRAASVAEVTSLFDLERLWDGHTPLVDYILGAEPGGGVFVVGHSADPYARDMMKYYKMGDGPFYVFTRPYHLCHFEAVGAAIEAVERRRPLMRPGRQTTDVVAYAKAPIAAGTRLDEIGGFHCYGQIEAVSADRGLPVCVAGYARTLRAFAADERIGLGDVAFDDPVPFELFEASRTLSLHAADL